MTAMEHVHHLSETIGPRGSTTERELEAARYAEKVLRKLDLTPSMENFLSARSTWYPFVLFTGIALAAELLFWTGTRWAAIVGGSLTAAALVSVLLELTFLPNPLRWLLPKGESQNVWVRLPAHREARRRIVLLGHLDSHRTPLVLSTEGWLNLFKAFVPLGLAASLLLLALFAVGAAFTGWLWRLLSLPFALVALALFLFTVQADLTPFSAGANDNATGAGIALRIAERLKAEPLRHAETWVVLSGCEEVGCYGADAFARMHRSELGRPFWIALDGVGGAGADPTYLTHERFLLTSRADPQLLNLAGEVASGHPQLGAYPSSFAGAYTEGAIGAKHGFRILSLVGLRKDGRLPEWHRPTDVEGNVDPAEVERTEAFVWELLQKLDAL